MPKSCLGFFVRFPRADDAVLLDDREEVEYRCESEEEEYVEEEEDVFLVFGYEGFPFGLERGRGDVIIFVMGGWKEYRSEDEQEECYTGCIC